MLNFREARDGDARAIAMRTVKLKWANGLTLAHPYAPLGITPSGAAVFEVTNVPGSVSNTQLCLKYRGYLLPIMGKGLSVEYA